MQPKARTAQATTHLLLIREFYGALFVSLLLIVLTNIQGWQHPNGYSEDEIGVGLWTLLCALGAVFTSLMTTICAFVILLKKNLRRTVHFYVAGILAAGGTIALVAYVAPAVIQR